MLRCSAGACAEALESRVVLANAALVADIVPGIDSSLALAFEKRKTVSAKGKFFFEAIDEHGSQLWVSDGVGAKPLIPAEVVGNGDVDDLTAGDGVVYFTATSKFGRQIFSTNGTKAGTIMRTALTFGTTPTSLRFVNGQLLFFTVNHGTPSLFRLTDFGFDSVVNGELQGDPFAIVGNKLFFEGEGNSVANNFPRGIYATDGNSVTFLHNSINLFGSNRGTSFKEQAFYASDSDDKGLELWKSNGTTGGTKRLTDLAKVGSGDSGPRAFAESAGSLYFVASTGVVSTTNQIYKSDGTKVTRITNLPGTLTTNGFIQDLTDVNGTLFFTYGTSKRNLYKLVNDTPVRVGTESGGPQGGTSPAFPAAVGDTLYFNALDTNGKARLFKSDGNSITLVGGASLTDPTALTNVKGTLFFQATDAAHGSELFAVAPDPVPPPVPPFTLSLRVEQDHKVKHTINEGEQLRFIIKVEGDELTKVEWDWADETFTKGGDVRDHTFRNNLKNNATRVVHATVTTKNHGVKKLLTEVTVQNLAPEFTFSLPKEWVTYFPIICEAAATDKGLDDKLTLRILWGDGTSSSMALTGKPGKASGYIVHPYKTTSSKGRSVRIEVSDGDDAPFFKQVVRALPFARVLGAGKPSLVVGGTDGNDKIEFVQSLVDPGNGQIRIDIHKNNEEFLSIDVDSDTVFQFSGGPGKDEILMDLDLTNPLVIMTDGLDSLTSNIGTIKPSAGVALVGTPKKDLLEARPAASQSGKVNETVEFFLNEAKIALFYSLFPSSEKIGIYAGNAADKIVSTLAKVPVEGFGGLGNDILVAGQSACRLLGNGGKDRFQGLDENDSVKQ